MTEALNDTGQFAWARSMWKPFVEQALELKRRNQAPRDDSPEGILRRLQRLEDERDIELTFRRYHACYDAGDVEAILSCYTEDAIQINARGTYRGHDELRESYRWLTSGQKLAIHHGTNVVVTLDEDDPGQATLNAFWFAAVMTHQDRLMPCGGTYVHRMRRVDGEWLIAKQRITFNYLSKQEHIPRKMGDRVPPSAGTVTTHDLVEERYLFT